MAIDSIKLDLRRVESIDVQALKVDLPTRPSLQRAGTIQGAAIRGAAAIAPGGLGNILGDITGLTERRRTPPLLVTGRPTTYRTPSPMLHLTVGAGISASAAAVLGVAVGAGIYGSTTPELGLYGSAGGGWWTNAQASVGPQITIVFGPPSSFAGLSWGVGANFNLAVMGPRAAVGGMLLFTATNPPTLLGLSFSVTYGVSAMPVEITVQAAYTWTHPIA